MPTTSEDLKSKIRDIAKERAAALFRTAEGALAPPGGGLAEAADLSRRSSLASILRAPMLGKELTEGKIFEIAVASALVTPETSLMRNLRVPVTDSDVNLVMENDFARLAGVRPPAPGRHLGTWEIDVARHHRNSGLFECIDIKRTRLDATTEREQRTKVEATSIAAARFLSRMEITEIRVTTLRWNACDEAESSEFISRMTIDAHLKAPVRETVATAFDAFRTEFDRRFDLLVERAMARPPAELPRPQRTERSRPMLESQSTPLTIREAVRLAMRARRHS